jgi:hypothetical protein
MKQSSTSLIEGSSQPIGAVSDNPSKVKKLGEDSVLNDKLNQTVIPPITNLRHLKLKMLLNEAFGQSNDK